MFLVIFTSIKFNISTCLEEYRHSCKKQNIKNTCMKFAVTDLSLDLNNTVFKFIFAEKTYRRPIHQLLIFQIY